MIKKDTQNNNNLLPEVESDDIILKVKELTKSLENFVEALNNAEFDAVKKEETNTNEET